MSTRSSAQGAGSPRYIVVEGPIGAGKTALAKRLASSLSGEVILEEAFQNPFLERFYTEGRLFAELNLDADEFALYEQIADKLAVDAPVPDLVIYLQASVDVLFERIARRGVGFERMIDRTYLEQLADIYARFFHGYNDGPLLIVNASQIDPVNNDADYEQLFRQIERTTGGRHFFNPTAAALA